MRRVLGRRARSPGQPSAAAVPAHAEPLTIFVDLAISPPVPAESAQDPEHAVLLATREARRGPRQGVVDVDDRDRSPISRPRHQGCPWFGVLIRRDHRPCSGSSAKMSPWGTSSSPSRRRDAGGHRAPRRPPASLPKNAPVAREEPAGPTPAQRGRTLGGLGARTSRDGSKAARPEPLSRRALASLTHGPRRARVSGPRGFVPL